MQPGTLLASLGRALTPTTRRCLASCGKPLTVLVVLALGATLFTGAATLLGTRQPAALFHAAAEGVGGHPVHALHALPLHQPTAQWTTALDDLVAGLNEGAFGVTFAAPLIAAEATGVLVPTVLIDTERPPLRIEIMGFDSVPHLTPLHRARAPAGTPQP